MSLRDAAEGTGLSFATLSRIETASAPMPSLEVLKLLALRVGLDEGTAVELAGAAAPPGSVELANPRVRRIWRSGQLSQGALQALRSQHLRELAAEFSESLAGGSPVDARAAARHVGLALIAGRRDGGFDHEGRTFQLPSGAAAAEAPVERAWIAHGVAHHLIARELAQPPECRPSALWSSPEREAMYLASHILVPRALLAAELRRERPAHSTSVPGLISAVERVSARFRVPADWAAARLTEETLGELL